MKKHLPYFFFFLMEINTLILILFFHISYLKKLFPNYLIYIDFFVFTLFALFEVAFILSFFVDSMKSKRKMLFWIFAININITVAAFIYIPFLIVIFANAFIEYFNYL